MDNQHKIEQLKELMLDSGFNKVEVFDIKFCGVPYYQIRYAKSNSRTTIFGSFDVSELSFRIVDNRIIIDELMNGDKRLWEK